MSDPTTHTTPVAPTAKEMYKSPWKGAFAAFGVALDGIKRNPEPAMLFVGAYAVAAIIRFITDGSVSMDQEGRGGLEWILNIVFLLAMPLYALAVADGRKVTIGQLFKWDFHRYAVYAVTSIVVALIVGVSLIALVFPVIWSIGWFAMATMAVADKDMGVGAALRYSKQISRDHKSKIWGFVGVSFLIGIGSFVLAFVPVIGWFVAYVLLYFLGVWSTCVSAMLYRWLQHHETADAPVAETREVKA